ncbi:MAG TPA: YajQ family cyclic di-GMP-binding protein [Gammaproteobacteria bacterium]|nr:YajQ family cyclic di-GMP-binding protein [Gammaproteobacteria bacterium]
MPSFDVVSEVNDQEVMNAVDQSNREISSRFDFRGVDASFEKSDDYVRLLGEAELQLDQMLDILRNKLVKRQVDPSVMDIKERDHSGKKYYQNVAIQQGIDSNFARLIVKMVKEKKMKVQTAIQGDQVRISGKKRDDLQKVIALLKDSDITIPLQFNNFRD